jgi:Fuc2NAc and GlcNAc transferase
MVTPVLALGAGLVATGRASSGLLVALAAMALISILGLVDDIRPLAAWVRFGVQVALATVVVTAAWGRLAAAAGALGVSFPVPVLAVLAILWIVWLTNLYNFMDGIDGIAGAQALIASVGLAIVAVGLGADTSGWLLLALAGSSLGFLFFNFPPSSIFMGDVGSTAIGFFFGILPLLPESRPIPIEPVALALSLFVLDATWTLFRRVATGQKWYTPHRTHLYQRPVVVGVRHRTVLLAAAGGMVVVSASAVLWPGASMAGRFALLAIPLAVIATGFVAVKGMERRVKSGA